MRPITLFLILLGILGLGILAFFIIPLLLADPAGDWGDAPDPDAGMDTGYYEPVPSTTFPGVLIYDNAGITAKFPTDNSGVQGPYTVDVDDFWIGPLANPRFIIVPGIGLLPGVAAPGDIPSIEVGAYDPVDPDIPSNLETLPPSMSVNKADCDTENGSHIPSIPAGFFGRICDPVPPYTISMSGRLIIIVGNPPLAIYISRIWFSPAAQLEEKGVYWNVLFDTNQDGQWSSSEEWVEQDQFVPFTVPSKMVITQAFKWGTSGNPFGRLLFPVWARSMVTSESVGNAVGLNASAYDGRGPDAGFAKGEIEDYFVEWRPIGQILPDSADAGSGGREGQPDRKKYPFDATNEGLEELLPSFPGPKEAAAGEKIVLETAGPTLTGIGIICLLKKSGVPIGAIDLSPDKKEASVCADERMSVSASWVDNKVTINIESAPSGSLVLLLGSTGVKNELGSGNIPIHGGKIITIRNTQ